MSKQREEKRIEKSLTKEDDLLFSKNNQIPETLKHAKGGASKVSLLLGSSALNTHFITDLK